MKRIVTCVILMTIFIFDLRFVWGNSINFGDCGSEYINILDVQIEGCSVRACNLVIGRSYKVSMQLQPKYPTKFLTQEVLMEVFNTKVGVNVTPDNPCASINCPVNVSGQSIFNVTITVPSNLISMGGLIWWEMRADSGKLGACMKANVQIVRSSYTLRSERWE